MLPVRTVTGQTRPRSRDCMAANPNAASRFLNPNTTPPAVRTENVSAVFTRARRFAFDSGRIGIFDLPKRSQRHERPIFDRVVLACGAALLDSLSVSSDLLRRGEGVE